MNIDDFRLRDINGKRVLVSVGETSKEFSGMLHINDSAAEIFTLLKAKHSAEKCAEILSKKYGFDYDSVLNDVNKFSESLRNLCGESRTIEEVLLSEGSLISTTSGMSMYPLLKDRRDNVVIRRADERLKKYDVSLYRRGEQYVLHRIIGQTDNAYIIIGDNCIAKETVPFESVIGVATGFYRRNGYVDVNSVFYKLYSRLWVKIYPARMLYKKCKGLFCIIIRKIRRFVK